MLQGMIAGRCDYVRARGTEDFTLPHRFQVESTYSTWNHGLQVESMWNLTHFSNLGGYGMDSRWNPWNPGGIQLIPQEWNIIFILY